MPSSARRERPTMDENGSMRASTPTKFHATLAELQALDFAIVELALYLDTHREDMEALELYRKYQELYDRCREVYEKKYGPLNHISARDGGYTWLDDPWPWELGANKEG